MSWIPDKKSGLYNSSVFRSSSGKRENVRDSFMVGEVYKRAELASR